jgi:uncharacterized protein (TIGR02271 family)
MPTRRKKKNAVIGIFESRTQADRAMKDLRAAGFKEGEIGLVARDHRGQATRVDGGGDTYADEGAVAGAVAGAGAGALVGVGVLAGVIPVVGPVLAVGTLGTILLNAAGGAAIAGIAGALIGYGIPEEDAEYYESEVKAGRFLVTVEANGREAEARSIMNRTGGYDRHGWLAVRADRDHILETGGFRAGDGRTVQLREEHLKPRKETVPAGEVGIRKVVRTEHRTVTVPVEREEVVVERRPASGRAVGGDIRAEEIRIPVREERVKVDKEAVVREEVHVGKRKVQDQKTVSGDVRKEELVVDSEGSARVRQTGRPGEKRR